MDFEDDIHRIGGLHKTEIELLVEGLRARITALEKVVCSNGRPGLEDRVTARIMAEIAALRSYVDERDIHKQNTASQAMIQLGVLIETLTRKLDTQSQKQDARYDALALKQDERHEKNEAKFNGISLKIAYASGAFAVIVVLVQHFWK